MTGIMMCPKTDAMMYQGMLRDWLAFNWIAALCMFFGTLWLYKEMLLVGFALEIAILPFWTIATMFIYYNQVNGNVFYTWWYAAEGIFQFLVGLYALYLYAWLKYELETRAREEEIKAVQGKIKFPRDCMSISVFPCQHKLWSKDKDSVIKRYDNTHQVEVRANILCPTCKNRIDYIME